MVILLSLHLRIDVALLCISVILRFACSEDKALLGSNLSAEAGDRGMGGSL
jgi:hypothetical protein